MNAKLFIAIAGLALVTAMSSTALADPGQEQACAGDVAEMQGIPMGEVRIAHTNSSRSGVTEVVLEYPGGTARCMVDSGYNILDIRWNHSSGVSHPGGASHSDKQGQEQACAGYFAQQMSTSMSEVRVRGSKVTKHGHLLVTVAVPGMAAQCNVDAHFNVVGLKFLGDK